MDAPARVGILADAWHDATAVALAFYGAVDDVWVVSGEAGPAPDADVLALDAETRGLTPHRAASAVDAACRQLVASGHGRVFKSADPALRGHVGLEALQALMTLGRQLAIVAPAFPEAGITTVGGYQLRHGVPVDAAEPHLPTRLAAESGGAIAHLGLRDVMAGADRIAQGIVRALDARARLLVVDAARPEDLRAIARAMALVPFRLLPVGTPGLARALQPHRVLDLPAPVRPGPLLLGPRPPVLVVGGSRRSAALAQAAHLGEDVTAVALDLDDLLMAGEAAIARAATTAGQRLLARLDVLLTATPLRARPAELGFTEAEVAARATDALARAAARAVALAGPGALAGVVVSGSATGDAALRAIAPGPLRVVGAPLPETPLLQAEGPQGLRFAFQAGGRGEPDAIARLIAHMKREEAG